VARDTRKILLDYTYKELEKFGYFQASTTDILKKCSIPKGSMYHYFSSKHDLTLAVINERVKENTLKNLTFKYDKTPVLSLISFIEELDFSKKAFKHNLLFHRLYSEVSSIESEFKEALDEIYTLLVVEYVALFEKAVSLREIDNSNLHSLSHFVLSSLFGIISLKDEVAKERLTNYLKSLLHSEKEIKKVVKRVTKPKKQGSLF
jgi:TetR/AcrR family transcriptional repressor of nem operon